MTEATNCPNCGMPRDEWPDDSNGGYKKDGTMYCCVGCGEQTGCTCSGRYSLGAEGEKAPTKDEIRQDAASGEFVQSLQTGIKNVGPEDYGSEALSQGAPSRDTGPA